jgi:hypothetical protein
MNYVSCALFATISTARSKCDHASGGSFVMPTYISIPVIPEYAKPIVFAFGEAAINWGRMEQHLEMLLRTVNRRDYKLGYERDFPNTSFRLKVRLFKKWYAQDPHFLSVRDIAKRACVGLRKANASRILLMHSNVVDFLPGPPSAVRVLIIKARGDDLSSSTGVWTEQQIKDLNVVLCALLTDLSTIGQLTRGEEFQQSLRKELSRIQKAFLWVRRLPSRLPRLCNRIEVFLA